MVLYTYLFHADAKSASVTLAKGRLMSKKFRRNCFIALMTLAAACAILLGVRVVASAYVATHAALSSHDMIFTVMSRLDHSSKAENIMAAIILATLLFEMVTSTRGYICRRKARRNMIIPLTQPIVPVIASAPAGNGTRHLQIAPDAPTARRRASNK